MLTLAQLVTVAVNQEDDSYHEYNGKNVRKREIRKLGLCSRSKEIIEKAFLFVNPFSMIHNGFNPLYQGILQMSNTIEKKGNMV
jgi:hypothetical protein